MMYTIIPTEKFKSDIEYYESKKKFKHIDEDIGTVVKDLVTGNLIGTEIPRITFKRQRKQSNQSKNCEH